MTVPLLRARLAPRPLGALYCIQSRFPSPDPIALSTRQSPASIHPAPSLVILRSAFSSLSAPALHPSPAPSIIIHPSALADNFSYIQLHTRTSTTPRSAASPTDNLQQKCPLYSPSFFISWPWLKPFTPAPTSSHGRSSERSRASTLRPNNPTAPASPLHTSLQRAAPRCAPRHSSMCLPSSCAGCTELPRTLAFPLRKKLPRPGQPPPPSTLVFRRATQRTVRIY